MKFLRICYRLVERHPLFFLIIVPLLTLASLIEASPILALAPLIDLLVQPDPSQHSRVTREITGWMFAMGFPVSIVSVPIVFLVLIIFKNTFSACTWYVVTRLHFKLVKERMMETFERFLGARWQFFVAHHHGTLGNTLLRETEKVGLAFESLARMVSNVLKATAYIGIAVFLSWRLAGIALAMLALGLLPFFLLGKLVYRIGSVHTSAANDFQGAVVETLGAAKLVLGFGNQHKSVEAFERRITLYLKAAVQFVMVRLLTPLAFEPVGFAMAFIILYIGFVHHHLNLSTLFIILYVLRQAADLSLKATTERNVIKNVAPSLEQIDRLNETAEAMKQSSGRQQFERLQREIVFDQVHFSYRDHPETLKGVSLTIPQGEMTAIVGKSGSGKTTFTDLLMGLHEVSKGQILVDGTPLKRLNILSWRKRIGFVPQDPFLFHVSIKDNLLWANQNTTEEEIEESCDRANAAEFIHQLPEGLDTIIGDRGVRLSGGQRQRIALARALLRQPEILILDEATSSLDSESERFIQESVERISESVTVVAVAHRLSTIQKADCIYVMEQGLVVESGSFDELMSIKEGEFVKAARLQGLGFSTGRATG